MSNPSETPLNRALLAAERLREVLQGRNSGFRVSDKIEARGEVLLERIDPDGSKSVLVHDPNLIVSLGRKVMSRMIGDALVSTLSVDRLTAPALSIVRTTTGSPTSAWVVVETDGNDTVVSGWINGPTQEWSFRFVGGVYTFSTLAAAITAVANWRAEVVGAVGTYDPVNLLRTPNAPCLGNASSYSTLVGSPHARTLSSAITNTVSVNHASMVPNRMRFGTQGHDTVTPSLGKNVLTTDEVLTSPLRAADLGNALDTQDYLAVTSITFPTSAQVSFYAELGNSQGNGYSLSEIGLFSSGHMIARKNFGQLAKTVTYGIAATWNLVF